MYFPMRNLPLSILSLIVLFGFSGCGSEVIIDPMQKCTSPSGDPLKVGEKTTLEGCKCKCLESGKLLCSKCREVQRCEEGWGEFLLSEPFGVRCWSCHCSQGGGDFYCTPLKNCQKCEKNGDCRRGEFCKYRAQDCLDSKSGLSGICAPKPESCPVPPPHSDVCGCDGKDYLSRCLAERSGITPAGDSRCQELCRYRGKTYSPGQSFPAGDGCNTCTCSRFGSVQCTLEVCGCRFEGKQYRVGEKFTSKDGCKSCICQKNGDIVCKKKDCP